MPAACSAWAIAVYRGTFRGSEVAVKKALRSIDEAQHAELRKEAETMQAIPGHANILQFFGACFDDDGVLLVVELCDAGTLDRYLARQPALDWATRLALCEQVAAGMSHLEHLRVVHRDLAARNVLLNQVVGKAGQVVLVAKVAHFGLARQVKDGRQEYAVNSNVAIRWAAPEVLRDRRHSSASDVWAFGVLCWEVFSPGGARPYAELRDNDAVATAVVQRRQTLAAPRGCDSAVWAMVQPCFAYEAAKRLTFAQLHASLKDLNAGRPINYAPLPL